MNAATACPCGSGKSYRRLLRTVPRSRATTSHGRGLDVLPLFGYVLAREDYLLRTWHESTRPGTLDLHDADNHSWLGL